MSIEQVERAAPILREHAAIYDQDATFPVESMAALRRVGLMGLLVPAEFGGAGAGLAEFAAVAQGLSAACPSTGQIWAMHCFQVDAIARYGSLTLKAAVLPRVAAGEVYIASVTSEPGRHADLFTAGAPVQPDGERLAIKREAPVVTGGEHADGFLITMRASATAAESEVSLVYADRTDLHTKTTGGWNALGMRATASVAMELAGTVPAAHVVGSPGCFAEIARQSMVPLSHIGWAACWLGTARGALDDTVRWAARSGAARGHDGSRSDLFYERVGRIRIDLELVSAYLTRVLEEVERARLSGRPLDGPQHRLQLNTLKVIASELTYQAVDRLVQVAGLRAGYLRDSELALERRLRDLRSASLNHANDALIVGVGALAMLDRSATLI